MLQVHAVAGLLGRPDLVLQVRLGFQELPARQARGDLLVLLELLALPVHVGLTDLPVLPDRQDRSDLQVHSADRQALQVSRGRLDRLDRLVLPEPLVRPVQHLTSPDLQASPDLLVRPVRPGLPVLRVLNRQSLGLLDLQVRLARSALQEHSVVLQVRPARLVHLVSTVSEDRQVRPERMDRQVRSALQAHPEAQPVLLVPSEPDLPARQGLVCSTSMMTTRSLSRTTK